MSPSSGPGESRGLALCSFILAFLCAPPPTPVFTPDPPSSGLRCWEKPQQPAWGVSQLPEASGLPGEPEIGLSEREGEGGRVTTGRGAFLEHACSLLVSSRQGEEAWGLGSPSGTILQAATSSQEECWGVGVGREKVRVPGQRATVSGSVPPARPC